MTNEPTPARQFWILMKQEMMGWHWQQQDHMQMNVSSLNFIGWKFFLTPNTCDKALNAMQIGKINNYNYNCFTALWILSRTTWVSRYQKKHSPTDTHRGHQSSLSASIIYYDSWHPPCLTYVPKSLFVQSLSKFSLVYLLAWHPPMHTPYISPCNHCLLFAAYAHTIATCFALVPTLHLELYLIA